MNEYNVPSFETFVAIILSELRIHKKATSVLFQHNQMLIHAFILLSTTNGFALVNEINTYKFSYKVVEKEKVLPTLAYF